MPCNKEKQFDSDMKYRIYRILHLAKKYSWTLQNSDGEKYDFFNKQKSTITIYASDLKVVTSVNHPTRGWTTLKREGKMNQRIIEMIFRNPRVHIHKNMQVQSSYVN